MQRRTGLQALLFAPLAMVPLGRATAADAAADATADAQRDTTREAEALLRRGGGGLVVVMRHALAPGTFDPPGFRSGDCSTQRQLSDAGRAQARAIGAWYRAHALAPTAVRSSAWCRCVDTAQLAFGRVQPWPPLDSMLRETVRRDEQAALLRAELARRAQSRVSGFEVWVTHQVNVSALAGGFADSGEAVLLRHDAARGGVAVLASLRIA